MTAPRTRLQTWAGRSLFEYSGSVLEGTRIHFGENFRWHVMVPKEIYSKLLCEFAGKQIPAGTSKTEPPEGSLGFLLKENVTRQAIASYIAAILVHEQIADKDRQMIVFR